ncbi:MAG: oxidoreductase [Bacteroidia bacterium]
MRHPLTFIAIFIGQFLIAQQIKQLNSNEGASYRGLSVVSDKIIWACGSKGFIEKSTDGGKTWKTRQVEGFENSDFRSIHAFSSDEAVIVSAGTPAVIMKTTDGGTTWKVKWMNQDSAYFLDGITFWDDQRGMVFGDPIREHLFLLETTDKGESWHPVPAHAPHLTAGESCFAASGTTIRSLPGGHVYIATGGTQARILHSSDYGKSWKYISTPMISGAASKGIFSMAIADTSNMVITGGDYANDTLKENHVFYTTDGGKTWNYPAKPTGGYRSCVEYIGPSKLLATGTSGTDISADGGKTWKNVSSAGFHTIRKSAKGKKVYLSGGKGRIAILK